MAHEEQVESLRHGPQGCPNPMNPEAVAKSRPAKNKCYPLRADD